MLLNEVYVKGEWTCDDQNKKRLLEILQAFPKEEPTRKRFITEAVGWSGRFGEIERGDPDIHHEAGKLYAEGMLNNFLRLCVSRLIRNLNRRRSLRCRTPPCSRNRPLTSHPRDLTLQLV